MLAGLAGFAVFLVLHHLWIVPIWFIAPVGAVMAGACGAAVGAAYAELLPHLPPRPWTPIVVALGIVVILGPSIVIAELRGPIYVMGPSDGSRLLVPVSEAVAGFVAGLLGTTTVSSATLGWLVGRRRSAAGWMALAGLVLAIGPGHNIPLLGATPAVTKEVAILAAVSVVSSVVLVETAAFRGGRESRGTGPSSPERVGPRASLGGPSTARERPYSAEE